MNKIGRHTYWTAADRALLRQLSEAHDPQISVPEIAEQLKRSESAVKAMRRKLRLQTKAFQKAGWTDQDEALLVNAWNAKQTRDQILHEFAERGIYRTRDAIASRICELLNNGRIKRRPKIHDGRQGWKQPSQAGIPKCSGVTPDFEPGDRRFAACINGRFDDDPRAAPPKLFANLLPPDRRESYTGNAAAMCASV